MTRIMLAGLIGLVVGLILGGLLLHAVHYTDTSRIVAAVTSTSDRIDRLERRVDTLILKFGEEKKP